MNSLQYLAALLLLLCPGSQLGHAAPVKPFDQAAAAADLDALLEKDWAANHLRPNAPAADEVFVRRAYLDLVGRIPTYRETAAFLGDERTTKRAALIDRLLASPGYTQHFFNYWADVLRLQSFGAIGPVAGAAYTLYLKESLRTNKPYDQFVRELISARGRPWENGAIGYYMRDQRMPLDNFANTARIFLGTRIECAQCHNHPFDQWTQMQFYRMTAFTIGNETKAYTSPPIAGMQALNAKANSELVRRGPTPAELEHQKFVSQAVNDVQFLAMGGVGVVYDDARQLELPHDYQYDDARPKTPVAPATMFGGPATPREGESKTEAYARWLTSPENPRFTTVIANRLWKLAFGVAVIEPLDDISPSNLPSNPELMRRLEQLVQDSGYDLKACLRVIFSTRAYQAASVKDEVQPGTPFHFTGPVLRRMSAEQMWDSFVTLINAAPEVPSRTVAENLQARVRKAAKVIDAVDLLTPQELYDGAKVAAESYRASAEMATRARTEIEAAKARKDTATADKLVKQVLQVQGGGRQALGRAVFLPAVQRLLEKQDGRPFSPFPLPESPLPVTDADLLAHPPGNPIAEADQLKVKGYDDLDPPAGAADEEEQSLLAIADYYGIPEAGRKYFVSTCRNQRLYWPRAADQISPAFRGSYLRIFGQSDRELIENSSREASVPQALALMNSDLLHAVMDRNSQLMLELNRRKEPEGKLQAVYLTLLSRQPMPREAEAWHRAQARGLDSMEDLIYALVNTRRFIFIE